MFLILSAVSQEYTKLGEISSQERCCAEAYEIGILALNEKSKEILFAECKWQSRVNAKKIVKELAKKASYVQWHNDKRKESFAIFAKSFSRKIKEFEGRRVYCFDLREMEKMVKK